MQRACRRAASVGDGGGKQNLDTDRIMEAQVQSIGRDGREHCKALHRRTSGSESRTGWIGGWGEFEVFSEGLKAPKYRTVRLFLFN